MKKVITVLISILLIFASCSKKSTPQNEQVVAISHPAAIKDAITETAIIKLPVIPENLDFAGEKVPLEYFDVCEALQKELLVTSYTHSRTYQTLLNQKRYLPLIKSILKKYGVPEDFIYLCMTESGLNPEAMSGAGAAGLWQFMPKTAKEYGMITGSQVDDRYNVEMATEAACKYFLDAYKRFGSWTLTAAAYNAGSGGVNRRLNIQGTDNYYDTYLPQETMRYVYRILSFKMICSDPEAYGYKFNESDYFKPLDDFKTIEVSGTNIDWSKVAQNNGTNYRILRLFNPWIRDYFYDNKDNREFKVKIPVNGFRDNSASGKRNAKK